MTKNMKKIFLGILLMFGAHSAQASFKGGSLSDLGTTSLSSAPAAGTDLGISTGNSFAEVSGAVVGSGIAYTVKGLTHRQTRFFYLFILYRLDVELAKFEQLEKEKNAEWVALIKTPEFVDYAACKNKTMFKIAYCLNKATGGVFSGIGSNLSKIGSHLSTVRGVPGIIIGGIVSMFNGAMAKGAKLLPEVSVRSMIRVVVFVSLIGMNNKQEIKKLLSFISSAASGMLRKLKN